MHLAAVALAMVLACDGGGEPPAEIIVQPEDQVVFEGGFALFQVVASGTAGVRYQWRRNGVSVPGATDSHLAVLEAVPGDDGATYSVLVTNTGADQVESRRAVLTVHPPLDLRFKWVGAPFTTRPAAGENILGDAGHGTRETWSEATGSPLVLGTPCPGGELNCSWWYTVFSAPSMQAIYETGPIAFQDEPGGSWAALPSGVLTSLDLHEDDGVYAFSFNQTSQPGEFAPVARGTVARDDLQALATAEGEQGRVLTAVSHRGGLVSYVSYGWSRAGATAYEARVAFATAATAGAEGASLAGEGYALTAFGDGDDGANGFVLVGTRARGETTPVPVRVIVWPDVPRDLFPGWAMVGVFQYDVGARLPEVTWILEQ